MATNIDARASQVVNVSEITSKINAACAGVERSLTKAQAAVGAYIDATGRLVNSQGKLVEGLSNSKIKLGQYVDEQGRVHTANGEFVADLNGIEQALGMYADAFGDVYTAQGEYVRKTAQAAKAAEEQKKAVATASREMFEASQRMREGFSQSLGALGSASSQLGGLLGSLSPKFGELSRVFSSGASIFQASTNFAKSFQESAKAAKVFFSDVGGMATSAGKEIATLQGGVGKLGGAFSALGGPVGIAIGAVAAIGTGVAYAISKTSEAAYLSDSFKELDSVAKKAGDSIKSIGDAIHYGAFQLPLSEYQEALKRTEETAKELEAAKVRSENRIANANQGAAMGYGGGGAYLGAALAIRADENKASAEMKNAWADYAAVVKKMLEAAREEQKTELDRLEEQRFAEEHEEVANDAEARAVIEKQIAALDQKIADAKEAEERAAREAADKALLEARRASGISRYIEGASEAQEGLVASLEAYESTVARWNAQRDELQLKNEELADAIAGYAADVKARLAQEIGVDFSKKQEEAGTILERLNRARELSIISEEEYAEATRQAAEKSLGDKLGIDLTRGRSEELTLAEKFLELAKASNVSEEARANALAQLQALNEKELAEEVKTIAAAKSAAEAEKERDAVLRRLADDLDAERVDAEKYKELREAALKEYESAVERFKKDELDSFSHLSKLRAATLETETAERAHEKTLEEIDKALAKELITREEATALRKKANDAEKKRKEQAAAAELSRLGVDSFIKAGSNVGKSQKDLIEEQFQNLKEARKTNKDVADKWSEIQASHKKQLDAIDKAEKEKRAQEAAQRREATRSALGVDSLMEELKTPLQKYREVMDKIAEAAKARAITAEERVALEDKAAADYWESMRSNVKTTEKAAEKLGKFELAKSMGAGSEALYLAQVRNSTANYQTRIQNETARIADVATRSYQEQLTANGYLELMAESFGAFNVFG